MPKPTIQDTIAYMREEKPKHTKPHQAFYDCAIDELLNVPKWISVSEDLPKLDKYGEAYVLVSMDDEFIATTTYTKDGFELWAESGKVVAWQPLPKPYKSEDKADE